MMIAPALPLAAGARCCCRRLGYMWCLSLDPHSSAHKSGVDRLLASYRSIPATSAVRLAKPTSNLFRARTKRDAPGLDTSGLTGVI